MKRAKVADKRRRRSETARTGILQLADNGLERGLVQR
jgi:hypothetical protein